MITAKNYAAQAEKTMNDLCVSGKTHFTKEDLVQIRRLSNLINESVHFAMPDDGVIINDNLKGLEGCQLRLPFPKITIEYFAASDENGKIEEGKTSVTKRLIIAEETSIDTIIFYCCFFSSSQWIPYPIAGSFTQQWEDLNQFKSDPRFYDELKRKKVMNEKLFNFVSFAFIPSLYKGYIQHQGYEATMESARNDIGAEARVLLEFLEALSCSNVQHEPAEKIDESKNLKRIKCGKLPFYETRILTIKQSSKSKTHADFNYESNRNSPRQHLRRGHIRNLTDRKIWVNSCVVGQESNGKIVKSYALDR